MQSPLCIGPLVICSRSGEITCPRHMRKETGNGSIPTPRIAEAFQDWSQRSDCMRLYRKHCRSLYGMTQEEQLYTDDHSQKYIS